MDKNQIQVLLIEDNITDTILLRAALGDDAFTAFEVTVVERLHSATESLQTKLFDVILLDLGLPDSNGLETFTRLHQVVPQIPKVILSGLTDETVAMQAVHNGAQDYLVKGTAGFASAARAIRYAIERQRSQIALHESENRFRTLFEHSPVAYQCLDANGNYMDFNSQLCELLGYEAHELMGASFGELWSPETKLTFPRKLDRFKKDGRMEADLQLVKKDGSVIEILMQGKIQHDINNQPIKAHCILYDITARKIAEQALRETQERFSTVFRSNPLSISITEPADGTIIDANEAFLNMFGYKRAEILRHTTLELNMWQAPEDRERIIKKLHRQGEVTNAELKFRRKTGEIINALASYRLIELNGKQYMLNMLNDITDRKQTEQALNDNEKRFNALLENGLDSISLLSADGALVWESPATIRTLDYKPDEFVGRNIFELLHPDDQERILNQFTDLVQKPGSRKRDSFRLRHADGSWRWVEGVVTNLLNEPSVNAMVVNYRDISAQKEMEFALQKSELLFLQTFQFSPIPLVIEDASTGTIITSNESYLQLTGYGAEEVIGNSISGLKLYPNNDQLSRAPMALPQPSIAYGTESKLQTKSGEIRDVLDWNSPINLTNNEKINLRSIVDITERKRVEEKLRESEARFASIFHANPVRVCITRFEDGRFLDVNETFLKSSGYTREEVIGHTSLELNDWVNPQERIRFRNLLTAEGRVQNFETQLRQKSGDFIDVLMSAELIELFGQSCILSVGLDITERKHGELESKHDSEELTALYETTKDLALELNVPKLLEQIVERTNRLLGSSGGFIYLYDQAHDDLSLAVTTDLDVAPGTRLKMGEGMAGKVALTREPMIVENYQNWLGQAGIFADQLFRSIVEVPMLSGGELIGVLGVEVKEGSSRIFNEMDARLLSLFAGYAASAMRNARLLDETSARAQQLDLLYDAGLTLNRELDPQAQFGLLFSTIQRALNADNAVFFHYDDTQHVLYPESGVGAIMELAELKELRFALGEERGLVGWVAQNRALFYLADVQTDARWVNVDSGIHSVLWMPVEYEQQLLGVLTVASARVDAFSKADQQLVVLFTNQIAVAMMNAHLFDTLQNELAERKQAEQALSQSESLYRQAIEVAGAVPYYQSYYDNGKGIKYEFIGEGIRNITGYGPEEFTTALWDSLVLDIYPLKDLAGYPLDEAIQRVRSGEDPVWTCEHRIRHRNGEIRWVFEAAVEVLDEHGFSRGSIGMYQDITERRQAENALRQSEKRLRQVINLVPHFIFAKDIDGRFIMANQAVAAAYGITVDELLNKQDADFAQSDEEAAHFRADDMNVINSGQSKFIPEETITDANGRIRILSTTKIPFTFSDSAASAVLGVSVDITERKEAEKALRESEQRYHTLIDQIPAAVYIDDASTNPGRTEFVSPYIQTVLGFTPDEWIQGGEELWKDRLHPEDRERVLAEYKQSIENDEPLDFEFRMFTKDERAVWVHDQTTTLRDNTGKPYSFHGVMYDITERKLAEASLRESEQRFRTLIDQIPAVVYVDDASTNPGRVLFLSPYIQTMLGFTPDEWIQGGEELWKDRLYPEDRERVLAEFKQAIESDEPLDLEYRLFAKDERVVWVHDQATTLRDSTGKPHSVHGIMHDITERKQAEASLHESEARYYGLFEESPISLWQEDFSVVKQRLDTLRQQGVTNFQIYLEQHPEEVAECAALVKIIDVNKATLKLFGADSKVELFRSPDQIFNTESYNDFREELVQIAEGRTDFQSESVNRSLTGERIDVSLHWLVFPGYENTLSKVITSLVDITERKRAESERQILLEVMGGASSTTDLKEYLKLVHYSIAKMIQAENFFVILYNKDTGLFEEIYSVDQYDPPQPPSKLKKSISAHVYRNGKPLLLTQTLFEELASSGEVELVGRNSLSWLGIPLITSMETIGVMVVQDYENTDQYSESDQDFLVSIAGQVALAVQRKQTEAEINHQLSELEALYENGLAISRMLEPKQIANRIVEVLNQKLKWHHATVRMLHPESGHLETLALSLPGLNETQINDQIERLNQFIINQEYGLSGWVVKHRTAFRSGNLKENQNYVETYPGIQSGLYVPIRSGEEIIGSIAVESEQENAFAERDERLLVTLANQAAISFVNARLYLRLQHELSERSYTEEKIRKLNADLEQRVQERTLEIETSHQRLELATASSGIGVWELKSGVDTFYWDERMHDIYGTSPEKFNPTFDNWLNFLHPEDQQAEENKRRLALTHSGSYESEFRIIRADGSLRYLNSHAIVRVDDEQNFIDMIGVSMDITAIKQAQVTLRHANSELERALRVKDEFLANMSHELRTPLNAILGLSESLDEQIAGPLNEKQQKYIHTISESGRHLLSLINDILDLAKIEAGQIKLDINKMDIHAVCQSSLRMVKELAQKKNQQVELDIDKRLDLIWADERRLKQMMVNLLSNAIKFTPAQGKIGLEIRADESTNQVSITVWDNGIGIKETDLTRLFQPFVQLDSGLARESAGTGLGLALVAQMARLHGGRVSATSQPGVGSRFTIILPWEPALATDTLSRMKITGTFRPVKPNQENSRRTILLVEDTEEVIMLLRDYLESAAYKVVVATNGLDGITKAKQTQPDLILMDVQMPGMDGLEATQKLRSEPEFKNTPIIALTALAMPNDRERCLAAGMDEYVTKPVQLRGLVKMIENFLSGAKESKS